MIEITSLGSSSAGNSYRITDGKTPLLLDAGLRYKEIQRGLAFQVSSLTGCLVTHEHGDHSAAVKDLIKAGVNIYTSAGTADALRLDSHRVYPVSALEPFTIGTWSILPFDVQHDAAEPLGFLLANTAGDKLLFATDTYYIKHRFTGLTHIMVECNYSINILNQNIAAGRVPAVMKHRLLRSHFSLENVKDFIRANDMRRVQEIHLLHLSDNNSDEALFKREIMALTGKQVYVAGR
ncbi:MBL fold metallo-hydrolase [Paenibacillus barcinonensis]|uniref:MBL fold metallo-hydrolase n=1 Tax=Paenibacillus barcinonensis TaxID=198119 RepID=A0A2V4VA62_PAEBA|nr:MBL fold metallo-hydrolase [Paenibacillus barcinonensis]PYE49815.1 phosphoribosyl 1,2-cyclic phosphodiesterase [Paenibacillus barcinonensis]QKS56508.1 MBL fold metallo-hydrolase [Paenibacillus barcinonensis]